MKIKRIHINNYRAFLVNGDHESDLYAIDLTNGENLLIYGENGSGKSSLFKAVRDFFVSANNTGKILQKNLFYNPAQNTEQPFVSITLEDDSEHFFSSEATKTNTDKTPVIAEANISKGFISYQDLLKLHFWRNANEPNLFSFFLDNDGLLASMVVPAPVQPSNKISFSELWKKINDKLDEDALLDYNTNIAGQFLALEERANLLLTYFQKEVTLKIDYVEGNIKNGVLTVPEISFKVALFGSQIPEHDDVLNEARLTALAISVYLAYILSLPPTDLRVLFLDDIFIGLDMSNRIPLIKILTTDDLGDGTSFKDFQIFMTTYDREWFNVARSYLDTAWHKVEFYVDSHSGPVERPLIRKSDTYKERAKFHFICGDYPASANYLRKAFEQTLRNILPENALYGGLGTTETEVSQITVSKQQLSIKETEHSWFFLPKTSIGVSGSLPRHASLNTLIEVFKRLTTDYQIPFPHLAELVRIKNRLLNPLSHDDLRSPVFKTELETGFRVLEELLKVKSKIVVDISLLNPAFLFFHDQDLTGQQYRYKFQLLANLRYVEYNGTGKLLNAECKPIYRRLISTNIKEENLGNNRRSVYDFCKAVKIHLSQNRNIVINETSLLNDVFMENGQALSTQI